MATKKVPISRDLKPSKITAKKIYEMSENKFLITYDTVAFVLGNSNGDTIEQLLLMPPFIGYKATPEGLTIDVPAAEQSKEDTSITKESFVEKLILPKKEEGQLATLETTSSTFFNDLVHRRGITPSPSLTPNIDIASPRQSVASDDFLTAVSKDIGLIKRFNKLVQDAGFRLEISLKIEHAKKAIDPDILVIKQDFVDEYIPSKLAVSQPVSEKTVSSGIGTTDVFSFVSCVCGKVVGTPIHNGASFLCRRCGHTHLVKNLTLLKVSCTCGNRMTAHIEKDAFPVLLCRECNRSYDYAYDSETNTYKDRY